MKFDQKAYDRARWRAIKADPVKLAKYRSRVAARTAARKVEDPEWHAKQRVYHREYYDKNKPALVAASKSWRAKNPGCRTKEHLKKRYSLSLDEYNRMHAEQGGKCALCHLAPVGKGTMNVLHVDHDHATGDVRALLCQACNKGLGCFRDRPALLRKAAFYLELFAKRGRVSA